MTSDPAKVSHTTELVVRVHVEDVLDGQRGTEEVTAGGVYDTLGLAGRPRSLKACQHERFGRASTD